MAANKTVWGIDLGQCALKAIALRLDGDQVEAIDHVYIEHPKILSQPEVDRDAILGQAMQQFVEKHDMTNATVVVGVPGQQTLARFSKLPPVEKKRLVQVVEFEAQQQIPFEMDEVIWDYQIFEDPDGVDTEVGIFAMRREILHAQLRPVSEINLEPTAVQAAPLALYNALKYDGIIGEEATVVIDIGTENTDLIVTDGDSLWTRNIPIGGNNFTEALTKTFKISFNKAERLKREAQKHKYARQIFQAMRPVFADLAAEVQRSIGFFTSARRGVKLKKILAMGSAFQLPGMVKFIQQNLGMEVVRPTTFTKLATKNAANAPELTQQLQSFGVAYGLALQGLGQASLVSSLLPPEIAKQIIWRKKNSWFYGAAACLALAAVTVWGRQLADGQIVESAQSEIGQTNFPSGAPVEYKGEYKVYTIEQPSPQALSKLQAGVKGEEPFAAGQTASALGKHLSGVLSSIEGANNELIAKAEGMAKLQTYKTVWPKLLQMVHSVLPKPDSALQAAMAQGHDAYVKLVRSDDRYSREKRREIIIENFNVKYSQDVMGSVDEIVGVEPDASGGGSSYASSGSGLPGFVVRLSGRTPYQGGPRYLLSSLVEGLKKVPEPGKKIEGVGLYFDKVTLIDAKKISELKGGTGAGGRPSPYAGRPSGGGARGASSDDRDPLTNEPMINDYRFEVVFAAVLGEKPAEPEN